jgi:IS30 family transposase
MEQKHYERLSYKERIIIQRLLKENKSRTYIAKELNRSKSTITRELNKWVKFSNDEYKAELADWCAKDDYFNKRNLDKIATHKSLKIFVYKGLLKGWSPEQIAGQIKLKHPKNPIMTISHEAIYTHIYNHNQGKLRKKLILLLLYSKSKRRSRKGIRKNRMRIKEAISIDLRPKHIEDRLEVGNWEGDLIVGIKQASAIGTLVERKTRYTHIVKLKDRKSDTVTKAFENPLNKMHPIFRKTMTYDNGMEMANHKYFTQQTGMPVYFAHPYSSWERGTNENTNGLIRRYLPKNTDFNKVTEMQLKIIQDKLNNRPRKVLGYYTPNEMMEKENGMITPRYSDNFFDPLKGQKKLSEITCSTS